jgi:hypothetical protein
MSPRATKVLATGPLLPRDLPPPDIGACWEILLGLRASWGVMG